MRYRAIAVNGVITHMSTVDEAEFVAMEAECDAPLRAARAAGRLEGIREAAEVADVIADEQDALAFTSSDDNIVSAYRAAEDAARRIATAIEALASKETT